MAFRTLVVSSRCKLDYKMGFMELRGAETKKVLISDLEIVIIENPAVSLTGILLEKLVEEKVKVIFCDSKRNPQSELVSCYGRYDCARKIKIQMEWDAYTKGEVWTEIVREKIMKQSDLLCERGCREETLLLNSYLDELEFYDVTNREGHSAKVYFNALFGKSFTRGDDSYINAALNYGYAIILSAINREIVANGYLTQLGIFHDNMFNQFNLGSDLVEPFRIIVDRYVCEQSYTQFETEEKHELLKILQIKVKIDNTEQYLTNAIKIYVRSFFEAMHEKDVSKLLFYSI